MSIRVLKQYLDLCNQFVVEPSLSGANRFKENLEVINQLSEQDLQTVIFDVIALL